MIDDAGDPAALLLFVQEGVEREFPARNWSSCSVVKNSWLSSSRIPGPSDQTPGSAAAMGLGVLTVGVQRRPKNGMVEANDGLVELAQHHVDDRSFESLAVRPESRSCRSWGNLRGGDVALERRNEAGPS